MNYSVSDPVTWADHNSFRLIEINKQKFKMRKKLVPFGFLGFIYPRETCPHEYADLKSAKYLPKLHLIANTVVPVIKTNHVARWGGPYFFSPPHHPSFLAFSSKRPTKILVTFTMHRFLLKEAPPPPNSPQVVYVSGGPRKQ